MEDQNQFLSLPCNVQFKIFAIGATTLNDLVIFEAFEDPQFSPISSPPNYLISNPKKLSKHFVSYLKIFKPPNNPISDPQKTLFQPSKNSQNTLFQTPKTLFQPFKKSPKTAYFRPSNTLFQIPKKTCKHHVSNLEKPYFRPAKHHVLDRKIIFQAPKQSYLSQNETMFQTQEIPI